MKRQDIFYEDEVQESKEMREYSETIYTKRFNNWIKTVLINKYCDSLKIKIAPSIFDLCSGRGGDLAKWFKRRPGHYVGLEYQESLVEKAMQRYQELSQTHKNCGDLRAIFLVGDAGDQNNTIDKVLQNETFKDIKNPIWFDIVSC